MTQSLTLSAVFILFLLYTALALSSEAIFTGIADVIRDRRGGKPLNRDLPCRTSLWSILVYGLSATVAFSLINSFVPGFFLWPWWGRGLIYTVGIYSFEFFWGAVLEHLTGKCPWHYRDSGWRFWRYLKPEYCWLWFMFGFSLEWIKLSVLPRML